jgi:hypothetical protein
MAAPLKLSEAITFGKSGKIRELDPYGFDLSENSMSWTQEEVAGFSATMAALPSEPVLRLVIGATPFTYSGHVAQQQFFLFLNGLYIGFRTLAVAEKVEFILPRNVISARGLRFELVIPTAASPKSLGISNDVRKLGIAVSEIILTVQK